MTAHCGYTAKEGGRLGGAVPTVLVMNYSFLQEHRTEINNLKGN